MHNNQGANPSADGMRMYVHLPGVCLLAAITSTHHLLVVTLQVPYCVTPLHTNRASLAAAVATAAKMLNGAVKPLILVGPRVRPCRAVEALVKLAEASQYAGVH